MKAKHSFQYEYITRCQFMPSRTIRTMIFICYGERNIFIVNIPPRFTPINRTFYAGKSIFNLIKYNWLSITIILQHLLPASFPQPDPLNHQ